MIKYPNGFFWQISSNRSGHNFIKNNIESWFDNNNRCHIDLEQVNPINFLDDESHKGITPIYGHSIQMTPELYSTSLKVICVRDLLNWYIAAIFLGKQWERDPSNEPIPPKMGNLRWEWEMNEKNHGPYIEVIPNEITKERYLEIYYPPGGKFGKYLSAEERTKLIISNWVDITKEFLGITDYVKGSVSVYYDDFFQSQSYRKSICNKLGGDYNERELNKIPVVGRYSTFDGDKFQDKAQEMKVLERYKIWDTSEENRELLSLLKNHEALELYLNNFDVNDDKKRFLEKWIM